jgi:hypothetical protein
MRSTADGAIRRNTGTSMLPLRVAVDMPGDDPCALPFGKGSDHDHDV